MADWLQPFVTFASAVSATVLNALWQDALIVLCVWLLLRAWPRVNAATRYAVWSATLVAALVVPVATTLAFFAPPHNLAASPTALPSTAARPALEHPPSRATHAATHAATRAPSSHEAVRLPERLRVTLPAPLAIAVFVIWVALAVYALVRLAIGLMRLEQLKRDALPLPVEYRDSMPQWLRANKGARDVRLCVSDETDVPVAVGLFDAMILVPHSLLERLSEPEVDQICLHELAHLRRADDWTNGLQRVVSALLGWNPAVQFIGQQLDLEREVACDDWVLSFVGMVRPYALCLTKMAESATWPRSAIPAPGVFATRKHISLRIERLLGAGRNIATSLSLGPATAAVAVVGAIALVTAFVAPSVAAQRVEEVTTGEAARSVVVAPPSPRSAAAVVAQQTTTVTAPTHVKVNVPEPRVSLEPPHVKVIVPATHLQVPGTHVEVPATHVDVPAVHVDVPATHVTVPAMHIAVPGQRIDIPKIDVNVPGYASLGKMLAQAKSPCDDCDYAGVNWSGRDLHGKSYSGVDFSNADLSRVNFAGGSFSNADFSRANLEGASFRNARLSNCDFTNANLSGADFTGASISNCDFGKLNLRGVSFSGARISGSDFTNAVLQGANLRGATLTGCDLSHVNLRGVDLSQTKISGSSFSDEDS
ncbi:MAG TPA: pentapeptide repeat-containing protein, partial [Candidatus Nitrosotalea sp.]|nr:pentapeptide repeat-containing protein [Candidatus Nitrosotalea sp.]